MESVFQPGELDHLVNEILSEGLGPDSSTLSSSSFYEDTTVEEVLNDTNVKILQNLDLDVIDIQDLEGGVGWEEFFVPNHFSESSSVSLSSDRSRETSQSEDGTSDFNETPWSSVPGTSSTDSAQYLCPVCGNPSGKHFYYGAQVCSSCRAFFRRSTVNSAARDFSCRGQQKCGIDSKSWKSCKFCRFQKCLSAGMKPTWVMNDDERSARNAIRKRLRKKRGGSLAVEMVLGNQWTVDEENQIQGIREDSLSKTFKVLAEFYSRNPVILRKFVECANNRSPFDPTLLAYSKRFICNEMTRVFSDLLVLNKINPMDRFLLLSRNYCMWSSFDQAIQVNNCREIEKSHQNLRMSFNKIKATADPASNVNVDVLEEALNNISIEDNVESSDHLSNLIHDQSMRERRKRLVLSIQCWPRFSSQGVSDDVLLTLMMIILICCPDSLKLQSESPVSKIQTQYCYILYRYINFKYPGQAHIKLGEGMDIVTKVRELTTIEEKALNQNMNNF